MYTLSCNSLDTVVWENTNAYLFDINGISVWRITMNRFILSINYFYSLLHLDEKNKASHFKFEKDKNAYIIRWGVLRVLLSKYTSLDPAHIRFTKGENNKSLLLQHTNDAALFFNISYSHEFALIAIANKEIGIDIERIDSTFNYHDLLPVLFSTNETELILNSEDPSIAFYTFFSRKESLLKATGKGINDLMKNIPVSNGKHLLNENNKSDLCNDLQINSFLMDGYAASISYLNHTKHISFYNADTIL